MRLQGWNRGGSARIRSRSRGRFWIGRDFWRWSTWRSRGVTGWRGNACWGRGCWWGCGRSSSRQLGQWHLVDVGDRYHAGGPLRRRLIENTAYDLYLRTDQLIEPWSLQFVSNLRRYVGQQIMPVTPGMVLANNAMQG